MRTRRFSFNPEVGPQFCFLVPLKVKDVVSELDVRQFRHGKPASRSQAAAPLNLCNHQNAASRCPNVSAHVG
jgi:hypothetical protein